MNIAVIVGEGVEASALWKRRNSLAKNIILFETNLAVPPKLRAGLPIVKLDDPDTAQQILSDRKVSHIVMVGSLKLANADLQEGAFYKRLIRNLNQPGSNSDNIKRQIHRELRLKFGFPPVKTALPFLFVDDDVGINPKPRLLEKALKDSAPRGRCAIIKIDGEDTKVFTVADDGTADFFSCCLAPAKLRRLHQGKSVKRFFFDRDRTIVIDYEGMAAYARSHDLTLQSFV